MTRGRTRRWVIRRRPRSTSRRCGARPHERACRPGGGRQCARPPPGSPLRSDPAARGACGDLDPVSAHRRRAVTGSRHRPVTLVARHNHDEHRSSRLHLSNARFWSERWGPPQTGGYLCIPRRRRRPPPLVQVLSRRSASPVIVAHLLDEFERSPEVQTVCTCRKIIVKIFRCNLFGAGQIPPRLGERVSACGILRSAFN